MRRIRADDEEALDLLMARYRASLLQYARARLGRLDEAEDLVQEVFVRVWEHRLRWEDGGSVPGYVYRIARNLMVDRARERTVREEAKPRVRLLRSRPPTPEQDAIRADLQEAFEEALALLPPRRREAFILVRFEGLSLKEAAEVMDLTARTVANHVYLAVSDLEKSLRPHLS